MTFMFRFLGGKVVTESNSDVTRQLYLSYRTMTMAGCHQNCQQITRDMKLSSSTKKTEILKKNRCNYHVHCDIMDSDLDFSINTQFSRILKKLFRKDSTTTKIKALQEFTAQCKEQDSNTVKSVLPFWPCIYNKLAADDNYQVQQASQYALGALATVVGREIAPYLRDLMGPLMTALCDTTKSVASAAHHALQVMFPTPARQVKAITYCKDSIIEYIQDNLFTQTPQTDCDGRKTLESKSEKVLASNLRTLRLLLITLPTEQQQSSMSALHSTLTNPNFWRFATHGSDIVRASFYSALSACCKFHPEVVSEYAAEVCPLVFHNLNETDPVIGPSVWEIALCAASVKEFWSHVNICEGMLPRLWSLLQQGGNGLAAAIYPNLLGLISNLPQHIFGEGLDFCKLFFGSLRDGLELQKVIKNPSERNAVIKAFFECAKYLIAQNINANTSLCKYLTLEHVWLLVEASVTKPPQAPLSQILYPLFVDFLAHLHHMSNDKVIFNKLWREFTDLVHGALNTNNLHVMNNIGDLIMCFNPEYAKAKLVTSQLLEEDSEGKSYIMIDKISSLLSYDQVKTFFVKIFTETLQKLKGNEGLEHYLKLLAGLCEIMSNGFMEAFTGGSLEIFSETVLLCMMKDWDGEEGLDKVASYIVSVYMAVLHHLDSARKVCFFEKTLKSIINPVLLHSVVDRVVSMHSQLPELVQWMAGPVFGELMVGWVQSLWQLRQWNKDEDEDEEDEDEDEEDEDEVGDISEEVDEVVEDIWHLFEDKGAEDDWTKDEGLNEEGKEDNRIKVAYWELLRIALNCKLDRNVFVLGRQFTEQVWSEILNVLPSPCTISKYTSTEIVIRVTFVCEVALEFFSGIKEGHLETAKELLLALFTLSCYEDHSLPAKLLQMVVTSWKMGIKAVVHQKGDVSEECFLTMALLPLVECGVHTMERLQTLADIALQLRASICEALDASNNNRANYTAQEFFSTNLYLPFKHNCLPEWASGPVVGRAIFLDKCPGLNSFHPDTIPGYMASICFTSILLVAVESNKSEENLGAEKEKEEERECDEKKHRNELILDIAYACSLGKALLGSEKYTLQFTELAKVTRCLEDNLSSLFAHMDITSLYDLFSEVFKCSRIEGHLWSHAAALFLEHVNGHTSDLLNLCGGSEWFLIVSIPNLHSLDAILPHLPKEVAMVISQHHAAQIQHTRQSRLLIDGVRHLYVYNRCLEQVPPSCDMALSVLDTVQMWRLDLKNTNYFAATCDISTMSWSAVCLNVECMHLMTLLVEHFPASLSDQQWDFILGTLVLCVERLHEIEADMRENLAVQHFTRAVCDLLTAVSNCINTILPDSPSSFSAALATDWEKFCPAIYGVMLLVFVNLKGCLPSSSPHSSSFLQLLSSVSAAAATIPLPQLLKHECIQHLVTIYKDEALDLGLLSLLNHLTDLLLNNCYSVQIAAFKMLDKLMPEVSAANEKLVTGKGGYGLKKITSPCHALMSALDTSSHILELVLQETVLGDCMEIEPDTHEYTFTVSYLLSWKLTLTLFKTASLELRTQYSNYLKSISAVDGLFVHLFRLMPGSLELIDDTAKKTFGEQPELNRHCAPTRNSLQQLACHVYCECLKNIPALLTECWRSMDKDTRDIIAEFTIMEHMSDNIIDEEISALHTFSADNMEIKVRPAARKIFVTYTIEEVSLELLLQLARYYPLGAISVKSVKRNSVQQRSRWVQLLSLCLAYGNIANGLLMWKHSVDKQVEDTEQCLICYSELHCTTWDLPRKQCRTCKKPFHADCIARWFTTYAGFGRKCPYCRTSFY